MEVHELTDGGQSAEDIAALAAEFLGAARETLELALYDVRLPGRAGDLVADALRAAAARGVAVRLLYNVDSGRPQAIHPPPATRPDILAELPIDARPVPGVPDLMHHKYAIRDRAAVWTGSANWTSDSWSRQENVLVEVESEALAVAYGANFEELWERRDVEHSGDVEPVWADLGAGMRARAWFTPGHGGELSQAIATAIGRARRRVRIASPVLTSGPVLATLAELGRVTGSTSPASSTSRRPTPSSPSGSRAATRPGRCRCWPAFCASCRSRASRRRPGGRRPPTTSCTRR